MFTTFVNVKLAFVIGFKRALVTLEMVPGCEIVFDVDDLDLFNCWFCNISVLLQAFEFSNFGSSSVSMNRFDGWHTGIACPSSFGGCAVTFLYAEYAANIA